MSAPEACAAAKEQVRLEPISSPTRLGSLASEWRDLWSAIPDATPFQSPEWLLPWWNHYGERHRLFSFAFWSGDHLAGLAPLYIYSDSPGSYRRVFLIGTGNTDYGDVVFHPPFRTQCWGALLTAVGKHAAQWDECDLQRLRRGSALLEQVSNERDLRIEVQQQDACPVLDLSNGGADPMLKRARYYGRKLRETRRFTIEQATMSSVDSLIQFLERLHGERWQAKGMPGVLSDARDRSFHREIARAFARSNILRLYALRIEDRIVAVLYGFCYGSRTYFYLSGFDPEHAHLSVGTILLGHAVEKARGDGCRWFDFLKGREAYKYRWGASDEPVFAMTIRKTP